MLIVISLFWTNLERCFFVLNEMLIISKGEKKNPEEVWQRGGEVGRRRRTAEKGTEGREERAWTGFQSFKMNLQTMTKIVPDRISPWEMRYNSTTVLSFCYHHIQIWSESDGWFMKLNANITFYCVQGKNLWTLQQDFVSLPHPQPSSLLPLAAWAPLRSPPPLHLAPLDQIFAEIGSAFSSPHSLPRTLLTQTCPSQPPSQAALSSHLIMMMIMLILMLTIKMLVMAALTSSTFLPAPPSPLTRALPATDKILFRDPLPLLLPFCLLSSLLTRSSASSTSTAQVLLRAPPPSARSDEIYFKGKSSQNSEGKRLV